MHKLSWIFYSVYEDEPHAVSPNSIRQKKLEQQVGVDLYQCLVIFWLMIDLKWSHSGFLTGI